MISQDIIEEIGRWERAWSAHIGEACKNPLPESSATVAAATVAALDSLGLRYTHRGGAVTVHLESRGVEVLEATQLRIAEAMKNASPTKCHHLDRRVIFLPQQGAAHGSKGCGGPGGYWELSGSEIQEVARSMDAETARRFLDSDIVVCSEGAPRPVLLETRGWPPPPYNVMKGPGELLRHRREPVPLPLEGGLLIDQLDPYWCPQVTMWHTETMEIDGLFYSLARYVWHYTSWARIGG